MRKISGIGIKDVSYQTKDCPYYARWRSMLKRVTKDVEYKDVTVSSEWLKFSVFRAWMVTKDWEGNEIDKDILTIGNKVYSSDNCCFVPAELNKLLHNTYKLKGYYELPSGNFSSVASFHGHRTHLGTFPTEREAQICTISCKIGIIEEWLPKVNDEVATGLLNHIANIKETYDLPATN